MRPFNHRLPKSRKECIKLITSLGFVEKKRIGTGKHPKYVSPSRTYIGMDRKPFILIPNKFFQPFDEQLCKKLLCFGISKEEIKHACRKL